MEVRLDVSEHISERDVDPLMSQHAIDLVDETGDMEPVGRRKGGPLQLTFAR